MKRFLLTFFTAMLPVLELRGAIPLGISLGFSPFISFCISAIGNLVPVPFIILLSRKIIMIGKKIKPIEKFFTWVETHAEKKGDVVIKYKTLGLILLVAIPLPGTGAWTGAIIAAVLDLRLKTSFPAILIGVVIAGIIVTLVCCGFLSLPI